MASVVSFLSLLLAYRVSASHVLQPRQSGAATIPDFVNTYAPLVYLDQNELYNPSDIQAQLNNTTPQVNFTTLSGVPSPLTLSNLNQLNAVGNCTSFANCDVYLTSKQDPTTNPQWLYGVVPDASGRTVGATSCAIIVNDHGDGTVDAFYMYFYAFNLGLTVNGQLLGNHVGDWEHNMIRFRNGIPSSIWYSAHDGGGTYTFDAVSKNGSRPISYSAIGSHANYAVPGTHTRIIGGLAVNDYTSAGTLWDPTKAAYYYTYTPATGPSSNYSATSIGPMTAFNNAPAAWLDFYGNWGDKQYNASDPRQVNFLNLGVAYKWGDGPTGPRDKTLQRNGTCPNPTCTTSSTLPATSGSSIPATVTRTGTGVGAGGSTATSASGAGSGSGGGISTTAVGTTSGAGTRATSSSSQAGGVRARAMETGLAVAGMGLFAMIV